ncbi:unnamed protein product [Auanema sp. JU1783]|nr:unnamed protein product [Auanema sp. JU1783]
MIGQTRRPLERKSSFIDEPVFDKGRRSSIEQLSKASPFGQMLENVKKLASSKGLWDDEMQRDLPKKWEKHGDMIVFPQNSFTHVNWRYIGRELWKVVADSLKINRLGRKRLIANDSERTPHVDILFGDHGWVEYVDERGIKYNYDASKRVFNNSKNREMQRIASWDCHAEIIVDMYAGLGYYTFPFLLSCHAKKVYAVDWDEDMIESLLRSATANDVMDRIEIIQGDARRATPQGVADHVYLGLLPSCRAHWLTACKALKPEGGVIHINDIIETGKRRVPKKEVRKKPLMKLPSVGEEGPSKEKENEPEPSPVVNTDDQSHPTSDAVDAEPSADGEEQPLKRKFSRSASIVEEMENRIFPEPKLLKDFEEGAWKKLEACYKEYAMECATNCTRFLNNINLSDTMYCVAIMNMTRYGNTTPKTDHIVLDILCCREGDSIEKLAAKFLNTNFSS